MLIGIIDDPSSKRTTLSDDAYEYARMWRNVCDDLGAANKEIEELEKRIEDLEGPYGERFDMLVKEINERIGGYNPFLHEVRTALEHTMSSHGSYTIGDCQGCIHAKKILSTLKTITPQQADRFLNP